MRIEVVVIKVFKFVLVAMKVEAPHPLWCPEEKELLKINIKRGWELECICGAAGG